MSTSAANAELVGADNTLVDNSPRPTRTTRDDAESSQTILFEDHRGENYVWPFELCRTYEAIKPLIEEVYVSHGDAYHLSEVRNGNYDIETDGAIILPSVWGFVVKPSKNIKISFRRDDILRRQSLPESNEGEWDPIPQDQFANVRGPELRRRSSPDRTQGQWRHIHRTRFDNVRTSEFLRPREYVEEVTIDVDTQHVRASKPHTPSRSEERLSIGEDNQSSESDSDADSLISTSDQGNGFAQDVDNLEIIREVPPIVDIDGNRISFAVDTSKLSQSLVTHGNIERNRCDERQLREKEHTGQGSLEKYKITKAVMGEIDGRTVIQIYTLPGPTNPKLHNGVQITWHHMHSPQLSWARFKDLCLELPDLSGRLKLLTREAFARIERHKVKAFLDGFFIEPGTVLRTIEKCQPDPQAVIFSCIPYLELEQPHVPLLQKSGDRLFPPRTLMQAMYPYEPVRDRDSEQAYRKLGNGRGSDLVYVPNLWMVNIGTGIVVTCGHRPLADEMVKSIGVVKEDLSQLGAADVAKNSLTTVRFIDREGLVYLYTLESCRSYIQMETRWRSHGTPESRISAIKWNSPAGGRLVTASNWRTIIKRTDLLSIDLESAEGTLTASTIEEPGINHSNTSGSVPPFFIWSPADGYKSILATSDPQGGVSIEARHESLCLEYAEKSMMNETLSKYDTTNVVDKTFASTTYYQSLPEGTHEHVRAQLQSLCSENVRAEQAPASHESSHAAVIATQCTDIVDKADMFCGIVQATFSLFVSDTDNSSILRKVWSAMENIHKWAVKVRTRGAVGGSTSEPADSGIRHRRMANSGWYIRGGQEGSVLLPEADKKLRRSIERCRRCTSTAPFENAETAITHLRSHSKSASSEAKGSSDVKVSVPAKSADKANLNDWIIHATQFEREKSNAGGLKILTQACGDALDLLERGKGLTDGVKNEDGSKSDLYTFPRELLEAFRKLIVFYLAVERALYYTEKSYQNVEDTMNVERELPYSEEGLRVLKRFAQGVDNSLLLARSELCSMVRPEISTDPMHNLELGPEYVCSWLMRRLMAKPLEKRMSIGDIYREYLSTIQFQVNHRPGKRLIRDLNLLQEELQVLAMINKSQMNVVHNYMRVLDDTTYEIDVPTRRAMFPLERMLLQSSLENLALSREEYDDLIRRSGPLSDQTKQSLEIYEEDHGKAITAFTVVTVIFLPLSFVTSFFGMNTVDIRDMTSGQSLFWAIALPLTFITIGATVLIGYNGDTLRDIIASVYYRIIGKQDSSISARGISVAQRKRAKQLQQDENNSLDTSLADEAEYARPQPVAILDERYDTGYVPHTTYTEAIEPIAHIRKSDPYVPTTDAWFRTQRLNTAPIPPRIASHEPARRYGARHVQRSFSYHDDGHYTGRAGRAPAVHYYDDIVRHDGGGVLQDDYSWHKKGRHRHVGDEPHRRR
ncbi:hypothetical protein HBH56_111250 [Parastagonospora nodorum]|uniref:Ubiquitin-like domain-containing protein n=1 Tax=Phaeosphaeria nodorum (strain SN15 / ATCC MYA-4574 / FGSC 10173) TaxID=321614 RepID=A0A7U2FDR2_PHANO|nr:hypothetical protein HBH56_111250 [Parastagonospora nodorum]QRD03406.1 hypothetical protein JI435_101900 [Parastagonospora nodorum SN15]KAH3925451.1 hypothetical protein HBH54_179090 [Parastagonospora nodorum]KAH3974175.1 hypothetical protein HBH51_091300 [Parastagonospora nodorum]KAH3979041.1 hypothetical protein HBH52_099290 [Parastagonospora nodorum]